MKLKLEKIVDTWTKRTLLFAALLLLIGFCCEPPKAHAGSLWNNTSLAIGGQGKAIYRNGVTEDREFEGIGNVDFRVTPRISVTGGVAFGFQDSYTRQQVGARFTATDRNDHDFTIWIGAGRYFAKNYTDGLDESAGEAGLNWKPLDNWPFVVGATSAYGFDSGREQAMAHIVFPFHVASSSPYIR